jgi:hypothetical protein
MKKEWKAKAEQIKNSFNSYLISLFLLLIKPAKPIAMPFLAYFTYFLLYI